MANVFRHPNRRPPEPVIRCKCDVVHWHDTDTFSIDHLTRTEAERIYRLAQTNVHLYALGYVLGRMLGHEQEYDA